MIYNILLAKRLTINLWQLCGGHGLSEQLPQVVEVSDALNYERLIAGASKQIKEHDKQDEVYLGSHNANRAFVTN